MEQKIENLNIEVTLKDNNPYSLISNSNEYYQKPSECKFKLKVRMFYLRKITINSFANTEEKRKDLKTSLTIDE